MGWDTKPPTGVLQASVVSHGAVLRAGTETENDAYTGAEGELTYDTTNNQIRVHDASTLGGTAVGAAGVGSLDNVVEDVTPQLGGDLDTNSNSIVTTSNADLLLEPNGTGAVSVSGVTDYENNVTADDDIPNKKFLDDNFTDDTTVDNHIADAVGAHDDSAIAAAASATNYTPGAATVEGHLSGIDTALGTVGAVASVFTRTGAVVAVAGDYTASEVTNVPAGAIAATDVQAAIDELDSEKAPTVHTHTVSQITDAGALAALDTVDTTEIDDNAVTLAKIAGGTANRLLGHDGSGDPSEITVAGDAALSAGTLTVTTEVSTDTTPVLGGDLTMSGNALVTTANADVLLSPNGSGAVSVSEVTDYEDNVTADDDIPNKKFCDDTYLKQTESIIVAASDETSDLTTGTAKVTFRMPYAFTLTDVRASVTTAPTGSVLTVDINETASTILSTKITIDATEKTSTTAATAPVISDSALADDAEITIDIDTVGSTIAGAGLKVTLIGNQA